MINLFLSSHDAQIILFHWPYRSFSTVQATLEEQIGVSFLSKLLQAKPYIFIKSKFEEVQTVLSWLILEITLKFSYHYCNTLRFSHYLIACFSTSSLLLEFVFLIFCPYFFIFVNFLSSIFYYFEFITQEVTLTVFILSFT